MSDATILELQGIETILAGRCIHHDLNLRVESGQILGLLGGSGSGKTTLLREMLGLLRPTRGQVKLFGADINDPDPRVHRAIRRRLGMLFQHGALFSALSVFDNVAFPLRELKCLDEDWIRRLVHLKLAMVELEPAHGALMPAELSGGMVKRVALARALSLEPELLLLDEPTAGLDPDRSLNFVDLVASLQRALGLTVIMVTHDLATLAGLATHVAVLADGHIAVHGTRAEVMNHDHPFVSGFFGPDRKKLL